MKEMIANLVSRPLRPAETILTMSTRRHVDEANVSVVRQGVPDGRRHNAGPRRYCRRTTVCGALIGVRTRVWRNIVAPGSDGGRFRPRRCSSGSRVSRPATCTLPGRGLGTARCGGSCRLAPAASPVSAIASRLWGGARSPLGVADQALWHDLRPRPPCLGFAHFKPRRRVNLSVGGTGQPGLSIYLVLRLGSPLTNVVTRRLARREVRTWCDPRRRTLVPVGSPVGPPAASVSRLCTGWTRA